MDEVLIPCVNNTLLISLNSRNSLKKRRINSFDKFSKTRLISPPSPTLYKVVHESHQSLLAPVQISPNSRLSNPKFSKPVTAQFSQKMQESLDFHSFENSSVEDLRTLLINVTQKQVKALKVLEERCNIAAKMIKNIEASSVFSEKDARDLVNLLSQMAKTVTKTSEIEIELGIRNRLYEKKNLELSSFKYNYDILHKRNIQSEEELKDLRDKIKKLQEENIKLAKINENEKQRFSEVNSKIQTFEKSIQVLVNNSITPNQDSIAKLKGAIGALLKDAYEYKKEIQIMKSKKDDTEFKLQQMTRKVTRLKNKIREMKDDKNNSSFRKTSKHMSMAPDSIKIF